MVVFPPSSPGWVRLATYNDMFTDEKGSKPKPRGPKFSHYRRSRVSKAPRKRTFIMHMTKYPDAWISALSSATSAGSISSSQGGSIADVGHSVVQVVEPGYSSSSDASQSSPPGTAASSMPPMKRRVSPFAVASAAAHQICDEDTSHQTAHNLPSATEESGALKVANFLMSKDEGTLENDLPMMNFSDISEQKLTLLGAGGQGSVYKGQLNGQTVAFKFPNVENKEDEASSTGNLKSFEREIAVLTMYAHDNIIRCLGVSKATTRPYFVEEYAERGSLHDYFYTKDVNVKAETLAVLATRAIREHCTRVVDLVEPLSLLTLQTAAAATHGATLSWEDWSASNVLKYIAILQALRDISKALTFLHTASPAVVHRDLKPDNVLLTTDGSAKLADFGVAKILHQTASQPMYELFGTANYAAPEDLWGSPENVGPAADIYSLGCIAWECFAGERPWMGCSEYSIMFSVGQGMRHLPLPESWPRGLKDLLSKCLAFNAADRPGALEVSETLSKELAWATNLLVSTLSKE